MNGKKVKRLRREAYGDTSIKVPRKYARNNNTGQIVCVCPHRRKYQTLKRRPDLAGGLQHG